MLNSILMIAAVLSLLCCIFLFIIKVFIQKVNDGFVTVILNMNVCPYSQYIILTQTHTHVLWCHGSCYIKSRSHRELSFLEHAKCGSCKYSREWSNHLELSGLLVALKKNETIMMDSKKALVLQIFWISQISGVWQ